MYQAKLAKKANLDALVCSAHEVAYVKKIFLKRNYYTWDQVFGDKANDQKRIMTPKKHLKTVPLQLLLVEVSHKEILIII